MTRDTTGMDHGQHAPSARVRDVRGHGGRVLGDLDDGVVVRLDDGRNVLLPAEALRRESDGSYTVSFDLDPSRGSVIREDDVRAAAPSGGGARASGGAGAPVTRGTDPARAADAPVRADPAVRAEPRGETKGEARADTRGAPPVRESGVIPVLTEELVVERRAHVTGGVRLHKTVQERVALIDEPVVRERVTVERVPVDRPLRDGQIPTVREQDGVLIVPVIEEVLVVEKRLMLKEELHIRRVREETRDRQEIPLRREHVDVERFEAGPEGEKPRGH
jgi:stress response protein YsnF